ncbi:hypothetical protein C8R43DRAFT_1130708 [Mycena crocata]|nr:hypothetical protein C8R43DRAFT_1130708 [Mycena crocata]
MDTNYAPPRRSVELNSAASTSFHSSDLSDPVRTPSDISLIRVWLFRLRKDAPDLPHPGGRTSSPSLATSSPDSDPSMDISGLQCPLRSISDISRLLCLPSGPFSDLPDFYPDLCTPPHIIFGRLRISDPVRSFFPAELWLQEMPSGVLCCHPRSHLSPLRSHRAFVRFDFGSLRTFVVVVGCVSLWTSPSPGIQSLLLRNFVSEFCPVFRSSGCPLPAFWAIFPPSDPVPSSFGPSTILRFPLRIH